MDANLLKILFSILGFQFLFVSLFLLQSKKGKAISNKVLAVVFLMISIAVINLYLIIFRIDIQFPQLLFIDDTFMFAYGPLLYLFTQSVIFKDFRLQRKSFIHFIPFLASLFIIIIIFLFSKTESISQVTNQLNNLHVPIYFHIGSLLMLSHIFYYLFKSKQEIKNVIGKVKSLYSAFNQDNFKLLKFILNCFIVLFSLSLIHSILPFLGVKNGLLITLLLMILFMFYFINSVLLKMLNHSTNKSGAMTWSIFKEKEKYAGSSLSQTDLKLFMNKLENHMKTKERFLDSDLNINDLSTELDMTSKVLSQVINEGYSNNFFDFVNTYRVEAAKALLTNQVDNKQTIQEVMYDSGFNSKSSFNTAFKKFTKLTPTQFKNSLQKGSTS
ncbi:helix-turn-helix domain-containing protein [Gillisia marina]|uniref:helix-turn-helix domain-containing protein n=1 Tax=Gillisia marina TaxID=1167637 RepID=UPI00029A7D29|nr:helix-turn-helix domain-containing protein [Gillisia marina]